jgi:uncharacterized protein (TIGR03067 family)
MKARAMTAKRRGREKQVTEIPEPKATQQHPWRDVQPLLDQELNGLPENYRLPIVLCDLESKTIKETALQLGWPQGTVAGRLARGRKLLAKRLASRGVMLSAGSLAAVVAANIASASVPTALMDSTVKFAITIAAGQTIGTGAVPAKVAILMEGALKTMLLSKLKTVTSFVLMLVAMTFGGGIIMHRAASGQETKSERDAGKSLTPPSGAPNRDAGTVIDSGAKHDAAKTDLDRLQGVWSVVSIEQRGGERAKFDQAFFFMVDGKRACWQTADWEMQGGLYLDPAKKPKTYDLAMTTGTIEGIYSLEGDALRLCYDMSPEAKRPLAFATEKGTHQVIVELKRTHGPEVFPYRLADGTRTFPTLVEKPNTTRPPIAPPPPASARSPYQPAEPPKQGPRNYSKPDAYQPQEIRPPKAADGREYVITPRLMQGGTDKPKEILGPKLVVEDGQSCHLEIADGPQNLLEKVVLDEKIKIGTCFDVRVKRLGGNKVRLFVSFQFNELEEASVSEIRVLGSNLQAIQDVELRKAAKMVFQKDANGTAKRWVEFTVDEQTMPAEQPAPGKNE